MPFVDRDGCRIRYETRGAGHPLLMLNFACIALEGWPEDLLDELAPIRRLVLVEHRGVGQSDPGETDYDAAVLAADACAVLDALGLATADVLGADLGAAVAQTLALDFPHRIDRVVLVSASCGPLIAAPSKPWVSHSRAWKFDGDYDENIRRALPAYFGADYIAKKGEALTEWVKPGLAGFSADACRRHLRVLRRFDSYDRLPEFAAPVLIVHGEDDAVSPAMNAHMLADRLPDGEVIIIPEAGHGVTSERPHEVAQHLRAFLGGGAARR